MCVASSRNGANRAQHPFPVAQIQRLPTRTLILQLRREQRRHLLRAAALCDAHRRRRDQRAHAVSARGRLTGDAPSASCRSAAAGALASWDRALGHLLHALSLPPTCGAHAAPPPNVAHQRRQCVTSIAWNGASPRWPARPQVLRRDLPAQRLPGRRPAGHLQQLDLALPAGLHRRPGGRCGVLQQRRLGPTAWAGPGTGFVCGFFCPTVYVRLQTSGGCTCCRRSGHE